MDQATIIYYALGYLAAIIAVFLLFLPILLGFGLLMLLAAAVKLAVLLLRAVTVGVYGSPARRFRTLAGRLPHGRGGQGLAPR